MAPEDVTESKADKPGQEAKAGLKDPKDGVLALESNPPIKRHGFQPGVSGNPLGRPKKTKEDAVLNLLREGIDPNNVVAAVQDLITNTTSWRAREAGVRLYLEYMVGKPTQRVISTKASLHELLEMARGVSDEQVEQVITVKPSE